MADEYHAKWSPSGAAGWTSCLGKIAMEHGLEDTPSKYADEGTAAHTVATWCFEQHLDAAAFTGRYVPVRPGVTVEADDGMADYVQEYVDSIRQYAGELAGEPFKFEHELSVEQDVPIDHITGEEGATGRADAWILTSDGEELQVHDLKYGRGEPVGAEGNLQLMLYGLGALRVVRLLGHEPKRVRLVIHQVRLRAPDEAVMTVAELEEAGASLATAAAESRHAFEHRVQWMGNPDREGAYLTPTTDGCRWCRAKATCSALRNAVTKTVFSRAPATPEEFDNLDTDRLPFDQESATAEWLAVCMDKADLVEMWGKAVRAEVERRLLAGDAVPRYKLVEGRQPPRRWVNADVAEEVLKKMRLRADEMYTKKVISPTAAEKVLKSATPKRWEKLQEHITRGVASLSVAPASDKRPAVTITPVVEEFDDLSAGTEVNVDDLI